ncbi:putative disease resistance protein RGA1 [Panicum virgatum]|uniref:putative disease resistance protein RGA1 n=1 Tax=Panicum virgatum TaxID=38727 RepID=UPI0019D55A3B|nr:putative disease resistance protein RGA1 [Panicum virgatum]
MASIEGAAVSAILKILANKLAPSMLKQYSSIVGVTMDLQDLKGRFEDISSWLEKAGCKTTDNDQFFIRKLKHVAYDVDDIVDEFHLEAEKHEAEVANNIVSKCLCTKPKSYLFQFKAALKIKAIKNRFDAIVKQRTDFSAIVNSLPEGHPVPHMNRTAKATPTVPNVAMASIICGREREKQEIISKLVDKNNQQIIKIVSIIGLGGSGKTALSNLVFGDGNTVKDHFEVRIWVHVPQEFDVQQLMMKMFEAITYQKSEHHSIQNIIQTIADTLTGKRYLLVLDDVWTVDRSQWEDFMLYIKRGAPGSSILLTSRNRNVAEAVESTDLSKLSSLSKDDSWTVFTQIIGEDIKGLDSELLEVGREIVNKCGGVPLAIKVLANVLRGKTRIEQWKAVRDSNPLDAEDKEHRLVELPKEINNLEKLQVLNLENRGELVNLPEGTSKLEKLQVLNLEGCRKLVELPDGIVKFERLQFAGISELANVGRNSEGLIIRGISHVLEKDDAHKASLKEKTNLQRLKLEWKMRQKGEVNTEFFFNEKVDTMLEEAVLDGLEPPAGIKELEICGYSGEKYAWWMQNQVVGTEVKGQACFQFLRAMKLSDFQGLKHLQGLVELPCLEELELHKMPSLESISCGPFPSLVKLLMDGLPRLEEVWLVAERTMSDGEEGGNCSNCAPHSG